MGFQSSFNQLLATTAGGIAASKHIAQQNVSNKIALGEEYKKQFDESQKYANDVTAHMNQLNATLQGGQYLNEQAKQGKMSRAAYEKAFQRQYEDMQGLYDQNQELVARRDYLRNRMEATANDIDKAGFGKSPIAMPKQPLKDMRKDESAMLRKLDENEADWKKVGRPRKGGKK